MRDPPVVVETKRYVDDPPRVIERRHVVEDAPVRSRRKQAVAEERDTGKRASRDDSKQRVIEADAEVTILGPDRMSIRLFRKGHGPKANARARIDLLQSSRDAGGGRGPAVRILGAPLTGVGSRHRARAPPRSTRSGS